MPRRTRLTVATAGGLLLMSTLGAALPAAAAPSEVPPIVESSTDDCFRFGWSELSRWMQVTLQSSGYGSYGLSGIDGWTAGTPTTEYGCLTNWTFTYAHPTDREAKSIAISLDYVTRESKVTEVWPEMPFTSLALTPPQAFEAARAHGYDQPLYGLSLGWGDTPNTPRFRIMTEASDYIDVNARTGAVTNYYVPDLPDSVVALSADRFSSGGTRTLKAYACPSHHPYLWNRDFGVGLPGVKFRSYWTQGKVHSPTLTIADGFASGWHEKAAGITVPDAGKDDSYFYALCTKDPAEAFTPAPIAE